MPCPHHDDSSDDETSDRPRPDDERGIDRRSFMQSALVIGGASALSSAVGLYGASEAATAETASVSAAERANRQHAWDAYEFRSEEREQTLPPSHHLLLHVDYVGSGEPSPGHRRQVAAAFDSLEETLGWDHTGVLFTVGYSPAYFDRFRDGSEPVMPSGLDPEIDGGLADKQGLTRPGELIDAISLDREEPAADGYDAVIHLASDDARNLLAAEALLWGDDAGEYGALDATLDGVFTNPESYPARRVGFAGHDNLEEMREFDQVTTGEERADGVYPDDIPDEDEFGDHPAAELSMGFNDLYRNSVPRETNVTILEDQKLVEAKPPGMFAQGTIQHVSKLDIDLESWYGNYDRQERRERMFTPDHDADNTGVVGENLGNSNAPGDTPVRDQSAETDIARETETDASDAGVTGHVQKTARARFDLEARITDEGIDTYHSIDRYDAATERDDDLPGHDDDQTAEQVVLRRDFDTTDQDRPGNHFVALMRFNPYMVYLRQSMNGIDFDTSTFGLPTGEDDPGFVHDDVDIDENDSGIVGFLETQRRGNYLVPPITNRALPPASADSIEISVAESGDRYEVTVDDQGGKIDPKTVQFGHYLDVNRARGASPVDTRRDQGKQVFVFEESDVLAESGETVRLAGKRQGSLTPVRGTVDSL